PELRAAVGPWSGPSSLHIAGAGPIGAGGSAGRGQRPRGRSLAASPSLRADRALPPARAGRRPADPVGPARPQFSCAPLLLVGELGDHPGPSSAGRGASS